MREVNLLILIGVSKNISFFFTNFYIERKGVIKMKELNYVIQIVKDFKEKADEKMILRMENMTINDFVREFLKTNDKKVIKEQKSVFYSVIHKAVCSGIVKPTAKINGNTDYSRYNWNEIAELTKD